MARAKDFAKGGLNRPLTDAEEYAGQLWGGMPGVEQAGLDGAEIEAMRAGKKEKLLLISIFEIAPDPMQPRRAMPHQVRTAWRADLSPDGIGRLFAAWVDLASAEARRDLGPQIEALVLGSDAESDESAVDELPPLAANLMKLAGLAGDLRANGQTNPITVYRTDEGYRIETGERRWLAFHLLNIFDDSYGKIAAREVRAFSVWRQAGENSVRAELNAISKARQLALLLMDLHGVENFRPMDAFAHELDFYAQVADGNQWRVPRGAGEKLLNAMGLQNAVQLRQYRALLRLPVDAWEQADDENWEERRIRSFLQGDTVTAVTVSDDVEPLFPVRVETANDDYADVLATPGAVQSAVNRDDYVHLSLFEDENYTRALARFSSVARRGIPRDARFRRQLRSDLERVLEAAQEALRALDED